MKLEFAGKSDIGKKRKVNQDAFCLYQSGDAGLFAVADGMGGHANGEEASQRVIAELSNWWKSFSPVLFACDFQRMLSAIEQAVKHANEIIYREWNQDSVCGTTVTALFIYKNMYGVIYAGDSRCYLNYENGWWIKKRWEQITVDEVWENQSDLSVAERKMENHPNRGKLVNAIGIRPNVQCRIMTGEILPGMTFLLCSDGLYKFCADKIMRNTLKKCRDRAGIEKGIDALISKVYENGAFDNISIIMVRCS